VDNLKISQHISRRYNEELEDIRSRVLAMGGLVEEQLRQAMQALEELNAELARRVVDNDVMVNTMEVSIDEECAQILAKRQPAASDLRLVVAVIKTITDLERIGDEAERIACAATELVDYYLGAEKLFTQIYTLGQHVRAMLHGALDAFTHMDTDKAVEVWREDRFVDREYEALIRELMTYMMEDPQSIPAIVKAIFVARAIERIGDRASNICEYVIYLVKGKDVRHTRVDQQLGD
jgi:phosphate transport system protein